jgi:hypothetical protein
MEGNILTKTCLKCRENLPLESFNFSIKKENKRQPNCRNCMKISAKIYNKTYKEKDPEKVKESKARWRNSHKEETRISSKLYRYKNKDIIKVKNQEYDARNRGKIGERRKNRYHTNINHKLGECLRARGRIAIKSQLKGENKKKAGSFVRDLGCSIDFLIAYLEAHFNPGMTWGNWGEGPGKWHIDHIVPLAWFDLTNREQFLSACNYTNLQPLWEEENLKKGSKVQWQF